MNELESSARHSVHSSRNTRPDRSCALAQYPDAQRSLAPDNGLSAQPPARATVRIAPLQTVAYRTLPAQFQAKNRYTVFARANLKRLRARLVFRRPRTESIRRRDE